MKLIIEIPNEDFEFIKNGSIIPIKYDNHIYEAIRSGTPYEERPQEWIPIKTRPLTEEEKEEYPDFSFMYDCQMPEDEQEVLVSTMWGVRTDIYCKDVDGCYFENYCDEDDVLAWMPLPEPYKEADDEQ